jgi:hypothetical protein
MRQDGQGSNAVVKAWVTLELLMKINSSVLSKLPGYHVCLGLVFFCIGTMAKDNLPHTIGSLPVIQLPCAFFSAVMIPLGSLLALHALLFRVRSRRNLLSYHLIGLVFFVVILSAYFYASLVMNRVLDLPNLLPRLLPKLVENARSFPNEKKRIEQAKWAYRLYGVILAYRLDNQQVVYYEPTVDDIAARQKSDQSYHQEQIQITFIKKVTSQFPYLFGLYASTYMAAFVSGWIWLLLKLPKDSRVPAS